MNETLNNPLFGIIISLIAFEIGLFLNKKTKLPIFNPLLVSMIIIIAFLKIFHIKFDDYMKGGQIISFFLGPATVILAVPLYKQFHIVKKNAMPIILGITAGSTAGIISIILLCKLFKLDPNILNSLIPKSITTPIGIEVSKQLGGIPSLTVASIIITGILGAVMSPSLCKLFRIKDEVAVGLSIGTSAHAVGTSKALEMGETEGALSSLSIGIAGLLTVFLGPLLLKLFSLIFK